MKCARQQSRYLYSPHTHLCVFFILQNNKCTRFKRTFSEKYKETTCRNQAKGTFVCFIENLVPDTFLVDSLDYLLVLPPPYFLSIQLCFALSMLGNPQITLLDEPSTGMDPKAKQHMW